MLALAASLWGGCKPGELTLDPARAAAEAPTRERLIELHNERVARLATTHSDGVVMLSWKDDRGEHSDQGDIEFWQTTGDRTALRVSKLGEPGLWLGSNATEWWLFDLLDKDRKTLYRGSHEHVGERLGAIGVKPLALLDLLGLTRIQEEPTELAAAPAFDPKRKAWLIETGGRGGRIRYAFDQKTLLPTHVELLDDQSQVQAESDLARWESVAVEGVAIMARPKMPLTITIRRAGDDATIVVGEVKIALNQTDSIIDERLAVNLFDVEKLAKSMRPDLVESTLDGGN